MKREIFSETTRDDKMLRKFLIGEVIKILVEKDMGNIGRIFLVLYKIYLYIEIHVCLYFNSQTIEPLRTPHGRFARYGENGEGEVGSL